VKSCVVLRFVLDSVEVVFVRSRYIGGANNRREADVIVMSSGVTKFFQFILYFLLIKTSFYSICLTEYRFLLRNNTN
jgi:hypothetical protein